MASQGHARRSPHRHSGFIKPDSVARPSETVTYHSAQALGRGFDVTKDFRLSSVKGSVGSHLIKLDEANTQALITPTGIVINNVSSDIKLDKGERTRFKSDVLSYAQMSERFNHGAGIKEKMPLGLFNSMYGFDGPWLADANATKSLALDGWFITLYRLHLSKSPLVLIDDVKNAVPNAWDPRALASFIEKYGTHVIVDVKIGGKNVVYVRQYHNSSLHATEIAKLTQKIADQRFEAQSSNTGSVERRERPGKEKVSDSYLASKATHKLPTAPTYNIITIKPTEDVEISCRRKGGDDTLEEHSNWMATIADSPDVIGMSFVPIISLLDGVSGVGFLSYATNLYLRYRPPIEELQYFLEFQVPKQWSSQIGLSPGPPQYESRDEPACPSMKFSLMGPKLYVNTSQVSIGRHPVTGLRLFLEGNKCNKLAVHVQHLSSLPKVLEHWDSDISIGAPVWKGPEEQDRRWFEPVRWKRFSHISTAPVEFNESWIGASTGTFIVTGAQLYVSEFGMRKNVLFMKLLYSKVHGCSIRRSQWDHTPESTGTSELLSSLGLSTPLKRQAKMPERVELMSQDSAIFHTGSSNLGPNSALLKFLDTSEMTKGPHDMPGHWLVSGAKLHLESGKICIRVKYSLLHYEGGLSGSFKWAGSGSR